MTTREVHFEIFRNFRYLLNRAWPIDKRKEFKELSDQHIYEKIFGSSQEQAPASKKPVVAITKAVYDEDTVIDDIINDAMNDEVKKDKDATDTEIKTENEADMEKPAVGNVVDTGVEAEIDDAEDVDVDADGVAIEAE